MNLIEEMDKVYDKFLICRKALEIMGETLADNPPGIFEDYDEEMMGCLIAKDKPKAWAYYFLGKAIQEKREMEEKNNEC